MSNKLILPQNSSAIKQLVDEAYLDIGDTTKLAIKDYITYPDDEFIDNPYLDILNIWRDPDNF